jgi:hypothetical protein
MATEEAKQRLTRRTVLVRAAAGGTLLVTPVGAALARPSAARAAACSESVGDIVSIAAVAEALATTFYFHGVRGRIPTLIEADDLSYLKAALSEEKAHLDLLLGAGAAAPPATFYFTASTFSDLGTFTSTLDALETAFIGAYAAAVQRFCDLSQGDLAKLASRILGVEAEHRVLGRVITGALPPNNLCLESDAGFSCVSDAVAPLTPFLTAGNGRTAFDLPAAGAIASAAAPFACS